MKCVVKLYELVRGMQSHPNNSGMHFSSNLGFHTRPKRIRVVWALGRFSPGRLGLSRLGQFLGWVVSVLVGGSFWSIIGYGSFRPKSIETNKALPLECGGQSKRILPCILALLSPPHLVGGGSPGTVVINDWCMTHKPIYTA